MFPYGPLRTYSAARGGEADAGGVVALARSTGGEHLAAISHASLVIWGTGRARRVLGQLTRDGAGLSSDGANTSVCWHPSGRVLAVTTGGSFVHLYTIEGEAAGVSDGAEGGGGGGGAEGRGGGVQIKLTQKIRAIVREGCSTGCVAGGSGGFWLGMQRGLVLSVHWEQQNPTPQKLQARGGLPAEDAGDTAALCCDVRRGLLGVLLASGRASVGFGAQSGKVEDVVLEQLPCTDATALAICAAEGVVAVGLATGEVAVYGADVASRRCSRLRSISNQFWGESEAEVGAVRALQWSDDGVALAMGWATRSVAVWSASGSRTMASLPAPGRGAGRTSTLRPTSLAWSSEGYALWLAPASTEQPQLAELSFVKCCSAVHGSQSEPGRMALQGADRLLLMSQSEFAAAPALFAATADFPCATQRRQLPPSAAAGGSSSSELPPVRAAAVSELPSTVPDFRHLQIPPTYISDNWPVRCVAVSLDGVHVAVAGRRGVALFNDRTRRWRVFGDVTQERSFDVCTLAWVKDCVVICNQVSTSGGDTFELTMFSHAYLDRSSIMLGPENLPARPVSMDTDAEGRVAVLCADSSCLLLQPLAEKPGVGSSRIVVPGVSDVRRLRLLPWLLLTGREGGRESEKNALAGQWACLTLHADGSLRLVYVKPGAETSHTLLASSVDDFWLTPSQAMPSEGGVNSPAVWISGKNCIRALTRAELQAIWRSPAHVPPLRLWVTLEPDVYPLGLAPFYGTLMAVAQAPRGEQRALFELCARQQPLLHVQLLQLLVSGDDPLALKIAQQCNPGWPHFERSLELLLHAVLDSDAKERAALLQRTLAMLRQFGCFYDVFVQTARKTDSDLWPMLFSAEVAGSAASVFQACCDQGKLRTASFTLSILQREGSDAEEYARRLLALAETQHDVELASEISRFIERAKAWSIEKGKVEASSSTGWW